MMTGSIDPLIDVETLMAARQAPDLRLLDASWFPPGDGRDGRALYGQSRIPGASFFDIDEIADTASQLPHMLPPPEKFASRMRRMGVGDGARIVVYDRMGVFSAARVWWMFRVMGKEDVQVLDGGFPAWEAAGGAIEDGPPLKPMERHFTARFRQDLVSAYPQMRAFSAAPHTATVLDARPAARFSGDAEEPRPGLKRGHIPGSFNVPWNSVLDPAGKMLSKAQLAAVLGPFLDKARPIVTSCGSGVSAAVIALALARLGRFDVSLYDGSWAEWGAKDDAPCATGAGAPT